MGFTTERHATCETIVYLEEDVKYWDYRFLLYNSQVVFKEQKLLFCNIKENIFPTFKLNYLCLSNYSKHHNGQNTTVFTIDFFKDVVEEKREHI